MRLLQPGLPGSDSGRVSEQLRCRGPVAWEIHTSNLRSGCDDDLGDGHAGPQSRAERTSITLYERLLLTLIAPMPAFTVTPYGPTTVKLPP